MTELPFTRPLQNVINRNIAQTTPARAIVAELDGRCLAVDLVGFPTVNLIAAEGELLIAGQSPVDPDASVSGSALAALELLSNRDAGGFASSGLVIEGDGDVAEGFWRLIVMARPDLEEELSRLTGDVPARAVGNAVREMKAFGERVWNAVADNSSEYLQEESGQVPSRLEVEAFSRDLAELRDDVERTRQRVDALRQRLNPD